MDKEQKESWLVSCCPCWILWVVSDRREKRGDDFVVNGGKGEQPFQKENSKRKKKKNSLKTKDFSLFTDT